MINRCKTLVAVVLPTLLAATTLTARAQTFSLEGAVIDSRTGNSLGVVTESGDMSAVFRAQKAMTFGILRSAGISLEQLSPEVRARLERFQTSNVEAFRAFSQGLDLKDQGKFAEARESFRRAAELDPGFALAVDQQQSMPNINVSSSVQLRAVMQSAATAAVDKGRATIVLDLSRALAALQAGQTLVAVPVAADASQRSAAASYSSNLAGSTTRALGSQVVALAYTLDSNTAAPISLASSNEWRADGVATSAGGVLERVRAPSGALVAERGGATVDNAGSTTLSDGTVAYWGRWLSPPAGATVVVAGSSGVAVSIAAPSLGSVGYVFAEAPRSMPSAGTGTFTPSGGGMSQVSGAIAVNFATRGVTLQNLGFQIGSQTFSGLNGASTFNSAVGSGTFSGNYTSGSCVGCAAFTPTSSVYGGNFVGSGANGLVFSTILNTGTGTASGVHLFTKP